MAGKIGILALVALIVCALFESAQAAPTWHITKDHWSQADEAGFGRFRLLDFDEPANLYYEVRP